MSFFKKKEPPPPNPKDVIKYQKREMRKNGREMDREILRLQREEQKLQLEIKNLAKVNHNHNILTFNSYNNNFIERKRNRSKKNGKRISKIKTTTR